jgi:hypothetical protein
MAGEVPGIFDLICCFAPAFLSAHYSLPLDWSLFPQNLIIEAFEKAIS